MKTYLPIRLTFALMLTASAASAGVVSGTVTDSATNAPLAGVAVKSNCASCSTTTNTSGLFNLNLAPTSISRPGGQPSPVIPSPAPGLSFQVSDVRGLRVGESDGNGEFSRGALAEGWYVYSSRSQQPLSFSSALGKIQANADSLPVTFSKSGYITVTKTVVALPAVLNVKLRAIQPGVNLAEHKEAEQIGTSYNAPASRAVDGETSGQQDGSNKKSSCSETNARSDSDWWQVDLAAVYPIGEVKIWNRTDCCSQRLSNVDVMLSLDKTHWTDTLHFDTPNPVNPTTVNFKGKSARYVRVQRRDTSKILTKRDDKNLTLCEVQVFAN